MIVSAHAAERYVERVAPAMTLPQARREIRKSRTVIEKAAAFGCRLVRLGNGAKLVLEGNTVVTVLPARRDPRQHPERGE